MRSWDKCWYICLLMAFAHNAAQTYMALECCHFCTKCQASELSFAPKYKGMEHATGMRYALRTLLAALSTNLKSFSIFRAVT